ncbi:hypothetical protein Tco_0457688 [Tanacetum coccineum]
MRCSSCRPKTYRVSLVYLVMKALILIVENATCFLTIPPYAGESLRVHVNMWQVTGINHFCMRMALLKRYAIIGESLWYIPSLRMIGGGAPSREITNLGLEREMWGLSIDKARRWLRVVTWIGTSPVGVCKLLGLVPLAFLPLLLPSLFGASSNPITLSCCLRTMGDLGRRVGVASLWGSGLRVADSHTGNHPKDDFTPLKTIRRSYSVFREKIPFELEGETFEPKMGVISSRLKSTCVAGLRGMEELPTKFSEISGEIRELKRYMEGLEIVAELKNQKLKVPTRLLVLPGQVTEALNRFAAAIALTSQTTGDPSVPSVGQAGTGPAEEEKNTKQVTITQLFQQRTAKDAAKANLNKEQILTTTPETTTIIPPTTSPIIIPTTIQLQSPFLSSPPKTASQPEGEHVKKDKGKNFMSPKDAEEKETKSDFEIEARLSGSTIESSKKKHLKKFDFVTEQGENVHLIEEQIKEQKRIKESVKADLAEKEVELGKQELVDLLGIDVINQKMINLYKTKAELELDFNKPLGEQDPIIKLNDLARKKRKHVYEIHDYFKSTKRYKSSVKYKDHLAKSVLNEPSLGMILFNSHQRQDFVSIEDFEDLSNEMMYTVQEIFFRLHQGPGINDLLGLSVPL